MPRLTGLFCCLVDFAFSFRNKLKGASLVLHGANHST